MPDHDDVTGAFIRAMSEAYDAIGEAIADVGDAADEAVGEEVREISQWVSRYGTSIAEAITEAGLVAEAVTVVEYGAIEDGERSNAYLHCLWMCGIVHLLRFREGMSDLGAIGIAVGVGDLHEGESAFTAIEAADSGGAVTDEALQSYVDLMNNREGRKCGLGTPKKTCMDCCENAPFFVRRGRGVDGGVGKGPTKRVWPPAVTPSDGERTPDGPTTPGTGPNAPKQPKDVTKPESPKEDEDRDHSVLPPGGDDYGGGSIATYATAGRSTGKRDRWSGGVTWPPRYPYPQGLGPLGPDPLEDICARIWCPGPKDSGGGGGACPNRRS